MILVTGMGRSGSWKIRGEQLGGAIGACVQPCAEYADCLAAALIVVVKRAPPHTLEAIRRAKRPWVWDVVDAWPQRPGQPLGEKEAKRWLKGQLEALMPDAVVWPTARMAHDARWSGPQLILPHHVWPKYRSRPVADAVHVVGYEGAAHYLGKWRRILEQECGLRGWTFQLNQDMQQADIGVALRDAGGWPAMHWKSNCKLANLQGLGIPAICSRESGYRETDGGSVIWVETPGDLVEAFERLESRDERARLAVLAHRAAPRLEDIAARYRGWLRGL